MRSSYFGLSVWELRVKVQLRRVAWNRLCKHNPSSSSIQRSYIFIYLGP